jgi:hypothetical protein
MEFELAELRKVKMALQQEKRILKVGGIAPVKQPSVIQPFVVKPPVPTVPTTASTKFGQEMQSLINSKDWSRAALDDLRTVGARMHTEVEVRYNAIKAEFERQRVAAVGREDWAACEKIRAKANAAWVDAIKEVMGEFKKVGGEIEFYGGVGPDQEAFVKVFGEIQSYLPSSWIEASNKASRKLKALLYAEDLSGTSIAAYNHEAHELKVWGSRNMNVENVLHEFIHHVYYSNAKFAKFVKAFFEERTRGEAVRKLTGYGGKRMVGKADKFFDSYCGRIYAHNKYGAEIPTRGLETLFLRPNKLVRGQYGSSKDADYINFLFGLLGIM